MDLVAGSFQRLEWIILSFLKLLTSTFTGNPRLYRDSFVSVEHLVLGFIQDQRFGKQFLKDFQISKQVLKSAVESIRGRQSVIDQELLEKAKSKIDVLKDKYKQLDGILGG